MKNTVVGFLFSPNLKNVMLIEKTNPEWQAGWMNGVGGKIEPGETPLEAMKRETEEEFGIVVDGWNQFTTMYFEENDFTLHCFRYVCKTTDEFISVKQTTEEKPVPLNLSYLQSESVKVINNLRWLIPMAIWEAPTGVLQLNISKQGEKYVWHDTKDMQDNNT